MVRFIMNTELSNLREHYDVIAEINLDDWDNFTYSNARTWLKTKLKNAYKSEYSQSQRIVVTHNRDYTVKDSAGLLILKTLQVLLNEADITNCFVILLSSCPTIDTELSTLKIISSDPTEFTVIKIKGDFITTELDSHPTSHEEQYQYGSSNPIKIKLSELTDREKFLLTESKTFCIYPWVHIHALPNGEARPCCHAEQVEGVVGNCYKNTLEEIWHDKPMQDIRDAMLNERQHPACTRCYEQEASGFFSGRRSANKHHGHHIKKLDSNPFELTYWDIRFSNLCNLKCRSCGHIFSSQWYQDQAKIAGPGWKLNNSVLKYAGRTTTDMWEQLEPHLTYVEQIYFAGGEPLLMEEHYNILEELLKLGRTDVRLIYNTNFTHTDLKGKSVFEYWKQFDSVSVGASLDDSGARGEYIRKGTDWAVVEQNRRDMLAICPGVDFYISPTLSIMNAWHIVDFHRDWVEKGLINHQDLNVNILQDPPCYRIDIAPAEYKERLSTKYLNHLLWLQNRDPLQRATQGFESAITFMNATDNSHLIPKFWAKTEELDEIRKENLLDVIPELAALK